MTVLEENAGENVEETTDYCIAVEASGFDNALLLVTYSDGEGGTYVEETDSYGWFGGPGMTMGQMMALELPEGDITFYSVWDLICGECEEHKVCEVHYIDDDVYYVCDDCYEEFAHGMGLE